MDSRAILSENNYFFKNLEGRSLGQLEFKYFGWHKCSTIHTNYQAQKRCFDLHIVLNGKGHLIVGNNHYEIKKNDFFIIHPAEVTSYYPDKLDPWEYIWIGFSGENSIGLIKEVCPENSYVGTLKSVDRIIELFSSIKSFENKKSIYGILGCLYNIIDEVETNRMYLVRQEEKTNNDLILNAQEYISQNLNKKISVQSLSEYLCVERTTLFKYFKKYLGVSPLKYVNSYKLRIAQQYVCESNYSFQQISSICGFKNYTHFEKCFTAYFNSSPTMMRKNTKYGGISDLTLNKLGDNK